MSRHVLQKNHSLRIILFITSHRWLNIESWIIFFLRFFRCQLYSSLSLDESQAVCSNKELSYVICFHTLNSVIFKSTSCHCQGNHICIISTYDPCTEETFRQSVSPVWSQILALMSQQVFWHDTPPFDRLPDTSDDILHASGGFVMLFYKGVSSVWIIWQ